MKQDGARILVVDDEPGIGKALRTNLTRHGFQVAAETSGQAAIEAFEKWHPDVVVLDLGLPDMDGTRVIAELRSRNATTPIIVLSVREAEREKVEALNLGADDYVTKPFGVDELLARIRVSLRHQAGAGGQGTVYRSDDLEIDLEHRRVCVRGEEVHLTPTEYDLLKALVKHPDRVLTDRMLLQQVWGPEYGSEAHYLHVYMGRLRRKIEPDPQRPRYIVTEPGVGYRLVSVSS